VAAGGGDGDDDWRWAKRRMHRLLLKLLVGAAEVAVLLVFGLLHYALNFGLRRLFPGWDQVQDVLELFTVAAFSLVYVRQLYEIVRVFWRHQDD
jgi:membrane protease YdiL (CAAX protease family)